MSDTLQSMVFIPILIGLLLSSCSFNTAAPVGTSASKQGRNSDLSDSKPSDIQKTPEAWKQPESSELPAQISDATGVPEAGPSPENSEEEIPLQEQIPAAEAERFPEGQPLPLEENRRLTLSALNLRSTSPEKKARELAGNEVREIKTLNLNPLPHPRTGIAPALEDFRWAASTPHGLSLIRLSSPTDNQPFPRLEVTQNYGMPHGLPSADVHSSVATLDGRLLIGTSKGIVIGLKGGFPEAEKESEKSRFTCPVDSRSVHFKICQTKVLRLTRSIITGQIFAATEAGLFLLSENGIPLQKLDLTSLEQESLVLDANATSDFFWIRFVSPASPLIQIANSVMTRDKQGLFTPEWKIQSYASPDKAPVSTTALTISPKGAVLLGQSILGGNRITEVSRRLVMTKPNGTIPILNTFSTDPNPLGIREIIVDRVLPQGADIREDRALFVDRLGYAYRFSIAIPDPGSWPVQDSSSDWELSALQLVRTPLANSDSPLLSAAIGENFILGAQLKQGVALLPMNTRNRLTDSLTSFWSEISAFSQSEDATTLVSKKGTLSRSSNESDLQVWETGGSATLNPSLPLSSHALSSSGNWVVTGSPDGSASTQVKISSDSGLTFIPVDALGDQDSPGISHLDLVGNTLFYATATRLRKATLFIDDTQQPNLQDPVLLGQRLSDYRLSGFATHSKGALAWYSPAMKDLIDSGFKGLLSDGEQNPHTLTQLLTQPQIPLLFPETGQGAPTPLTIVENHVFLAVGTDLYHSTLGTLEGRGSFEKLVSLESPSKVPVIIQDLCSKPQIQPETGRMHLFVTTNQGLYEIKTQPPHIEYYGVSDGLPSLELGACSYRSGKLLIETPHGPSLGL